MPTRSPPAEPAGRPPARLDDAAMLAACRAALAQGSRTFLAASHILPARVRDPACALYAFCRMADDAVDEGGDAQAAVDDLRRRITACHGGRPADVLEDRALAAVMQRHQIPLAWPLALIEGFAWDAQGRRYESLDEVLDYAARVAGAVGAMMSALMGASSPQALARACDLGVAMQLSNIARDVGEDARRGRLYLPRRWLREAGLDPDAWLACPVFCPAIAQATERLLRHADELYARVGAGVAELPLDCRPGINAARFLYREIGEEVRRRDLDAVGGRAVVSVPRKLLGLAHALVALWPSRLDAERPPLPATAFLVQARAPWTTPAACGAAPGWWHLRTRTVRTLELFEALARRDRERRLPARTATG